MGNDHQLSTAAAVHFCQILWFKFKDHRFDGAIDTE